MQKKVLTEQVLYYGDVKLPEGFEINQDKLKSDRDWETYDIYPTIFYLLIEKDEHPYATHNVVFSNLDIL